MYSGETNGNGEGNFSLKYLNSKCYSIENKRNAIVTKIDSSSRISTPCKYQASKTQTHALLLQRNNQHFLAIPPTDAQPTHSKLKENLPLMKIINHHMEDKRKEKPREKINHFDLPSLLEKTYLKDMHYNKKNKCQSDVKQYPKHISLETMKIDNKNLPNYPKEDTSFCSPLKYSVPKTNLELKKKSINSSPIKNVVNLKKCNNSTLGSEISSQQNENHSNGCSNTLQEQKSFLKNLERKINLKEDLRKTSSLKENSESQTSTGGKDKAVKKISLKQYKERKTENVSIQNHSESKKSSENLERLKDIPTNVPNSHRTSSNMDVLKEKKSMQSSNPKLITSTENFYGSKTRENVKKKVKTKSFEEPVILTLSSDEEENEESSKAEAGKRKHDQTSGNSGEEPTSSEINSAADEKHYDEELFSGNVGEDFVALECKRVLIGTYRVVPKSRLKVTRGCFTMVVPTLVKGIPPVTLIMREKGILKVAVHLEDEFPVLFLYIKPSMAKYIANLLKMSPHNGPYLDPHSKDERNHRITIFTEQIKPEFITSIKEFWTNLPSSSSSSTPPSLLELSTEEASDIVERIICSPVEEEKYTTNRESKKLFVFPPAPQKGGITITTDDYCCLEEEQFLNDVIIDFYLKWLMMSCENEKYRDRTHVFSTFFYKRLTSKQKTRRTCLEEDSGLTPAHRRHARVQSWTKNIDIFSKDFILVPINEHSHWFLAVICYPGLEGPVRLSDNKPVPSLSSKTSHTVALPKRKIKPEIPPKFDSEGSDCDEAEGEEEDDLHRDDSEEFGPFEKKVKVTKESVSQEAIKQPCILIFDSLVGASRLNIVATLREYLAVEYEKKKNKKKIFNKETMKGALPKVPQQNNFSDCGIYILQYAESFFQHPLKDFRFPIRSLSDWFSQDVVACKRQSIAGLIRDLLNKYNSNHNMVLPKLVFGSKEDKKEKRKEKLSEVRKYERKIKRGDRNDKNGGMSTLDDFLIKDYTSDRFSSSVLSGVDGGKEEKENHENKRRRLALQKEDTVTSRKTSNSRQHTPSPLDNSDDNDSGHHSDIDDSRESFNKAFCHEESFRNSLSPKDEKSFTKPNHLSLSSEAKAENDLAYKSEDESILNQRIVTHFGRCYGKSKKKTLSETSKPDPNKSEVGKL